MAEPPPANRREAMKRAREKQREARAEQRAGMMAGKEEFLLARDQGPERRLVRDIVDSRRNIGVVLPARRADRGHRLGPEHAGARAAGGERVLGRARGLGVVVDSFILTRRMKRLLSERFPKSTRRRARTTGTRSCAASTSAGCGCRPPGQARRHLTPRSS